MKWESVLVLAPHTDDAELGCGGTLARLVDEGVTVHVAAFSRARESLPPGAPADLLRREFDDAMDVLGVAAAHRMVYDYPVRRFSYHRQELLEDLVKLRRELQPQAVFLPSGSDRHQDHEVVHAEGFRAFKGGTVWGYELPWNHVTFSSHAFVTLDAAHVERKWQALTRYRSQLELGRAYFSREAVEGLARVRGLQVAAPFAEAFEVLRIRW